MADAPPIPDSDESAPTPPRRMFALLRRIWVAAAPLYASPQRIIAVVASVALIGTGTVMLIRNRAKLSDVEKLQHALELLADRDDIDARQNARDLAQELQQSGFRDPHFPGGAEFILGIVDFRRAQDADLDRQERLYLRASRKLREAERQALAEEFRPQWSYALGVSLHELGNSTEALPLLQVARRNYKDGQVDAAMRLITILGDRKTTPELRTALKHADSLLGDKRLNHVQRDRVFLNKAQVHLALGEHRAAQSALKSVSNASAGSQGSRLFRGRTHMAMAEMLIRQRRYSALPAAVSAILRDRAVRRYQAAMTDFTAVAATTGLDTLFPRQARYLSGLCAQRLAELEAAAGTMPNYDTAINLFGRTVREFPGTHESTAASLRAADLLRIAGRSEEALNAFRRALRPSGRRADSHNRWITQQELRQALFHSWNEWMERRDYASAIELAEMLPPVVPEIRASELHAIANMEWARKLEADVPQTPASKRPEVRLRLLKRRRETGASYLRYAELVKTSNRYSGALWTSAINFHSGHDFDAALRQYNAFIDTQPKEQMAKARVNRAKVLMDLDRLKESLEELKAVRARFPQNEASFEALFLQGTCHLELNEPDQAEVVWRSILASPKLTPDAAEWRMSLFSLGRHLFHKAKILKERAAKQQAKPKEAAATRNQAVAVWRESIQRLEEFESRYIQKHNTVAAQFLIAKAAQELARVSREQRDEAEVENVRNQYLRRMNLRLRQAESRYRTLQTQLLREEEADRLESLGRSYLRDCYYELAHTLYALERFDAAILAYTNAANRYPQDPQVLLAYLQMANCNDRLGDPAEAVSLILQAEVILKQLPDKVFQSRLTGLTKKEWQNWLTWARQSRRNRATPTPRLLP